jgi:hypothetical protein
MNATWKRLAALCAGLWSALACAAPPAPLAPGDFAFGWELIGGTGSLRGVILPPEVYRRILRADLGDLRMFDATGREVPMLLRQPRSDAAEQVERRPLVWFPLPQPPSERQPLGGLALEVERSAAGEVLRLRGDTAPTHDSAAAPDASPPRAYLLDTGAMATGPALRALTLQWHSDAPGLLARVRLAGSDDLQQWQPLRAEGAISSLRHGDSQLERNRIETDSRRRFLRLEWVEPAPAHLTGVEGEFRESRSLPPEEHSLPLSPPIAGETPGEYLFETGGPFPLRELTLAAPAVGLLYTGELFSRAAPKRPWVPRGRFQQYRLEIGAVSVTAAPIPLPEVADRYWRIRFQPADGLRETELPSIEARYRPAQLLFLAQGQPPWLLACGNPAVPPQPARLETLLGKIPLEQAAPSGVTLGPEQALGGGLPTDAANSWPWRTWLLWGVLLAAVGLLLRMARGLWLEMGEAGGK